MNRNQIDAGTYRDETIQHYARRVWIGAGVLGLVAVYVWTPLAWMAIAVALIAGVLDLRSGQRLCQWDDLYRESVRAEREDARQEELFAGRWAA